MNIAAIRVRTRRWLDRLLARPVLDQPLLLAVLLLCAIGLTVLYGASGGRLGLVANQAARLGLGLALLLLLSRIPPAILRSWTPWLFVGSLVLLALVPFIGSGRSARLWIRPSCLRLPSATRGAPWRSSRPATARPPAAR